MPVDAETASPFNRNQQHEWKQTSEQKSRMRPRALRFMLNPRLAKLRLCMHA
jgi:hypothetical protein